MVGAPHDGPLAATLARARGLDPVYLRVTLGEATGERTLRGTDLVTGGLDDVLSDAAAHCAGAHDYLGASVAHMVTDALLVASLPALLLERRVPEVSLDRVAVRRHPTEPWLDHVWISPSRFWALPNDAAAGDPGAVVVADMPALHAAFAGQLVDGLSPVFTEIRKRAPFGLIGMWGQVADGVYSLALWLAHQRRGDQSAAWDEAAALVDQLAERVPQLRARPTRFPVATSTDERLFSVRGTCCLWYKSQPDEPVSAGCCTTCPLRDDADRMERLVHYLESEGSK